MSQRKRRRPPARKEKKKKSPMSAVYIIILVIAVAGLGWYFFSEFGYRTKFNEAVNELDSSFQALDSKGIESSMKKFESLKAQNSGNPERLKLINDNLVKCYRHLGSRYEIPLKEQVSYLKKIEAISPDLLTDKEKQLLK